MSVDIKKLKELQSNLDEAARIETLHNIQENFINILLDDDLQQVFSKEKSREIPKVSKRVISHWVKKGLVKAEQSNKGGWFLFTRTEIVWIEIITQLREFGLDLNSIKKVREQIFEERVDGFTILDFSLMYSILKEPYLLIINGEGNTNVLSASLYAKNISNGLIIEPSIILNLFHLAKQIYPNNNFHLGAESEQIDTLNPSELKLLYFIRTGDFQEIKIRLNEEDIFLVEGKKKINYTNNLINIIKEKAYQDIEIKTENGKIAYISSTEKIRIK